jgi:DUF4097 and DUF4098 domain-containing protein YvlB
MVEVVAFRRYGVPTFTGGEVVLVVLICIAGSAVWQAREHGVQFHVGGLEMLGEQYDYPVSASGRAFGVHRIAFENPRGSIKVIGADTHEISVTGHKYIRSWTHSDADQTNTNTPVVVAVEGDRVVVRSNQERAPDNQRISDDLEVVVPRSIAVEARGRSGDYEITDLTGDIELASDHGDVRLSRLGGNVRLNVGRSDVIRATDVKGRMDIEGGGSDLELENIEGQVTINGGYRGTLEFKNLAKPLLLQGARSTELRVAAVPGRINMDLGQFTASGLVGPVRLVTKSRDIKLERFTESLELDTERGDVELNPGGTSLPSIEARSGNGRIELVLPPKSAFELVATAERGEATNDFGSPIETEHEGRTATLKGKMGDGPSIHVIANRGSVSVRKQGADASDLPPLPPLPGKTPKPAKSKEVAL